MSFIEERHTEVDISLKKHLITAENITVKRDPDDFDNRETCTKVIFSLKNHPSTAENITSIKREPGDFDNRTTANEVDRDLDQKSTIKSEEENIINCQNLISHEEVDIKDEDDLEQSETRISAIEKNEYQQNNKIVAPQSAQPNTRVELYKCNRQIKMYLCPDCPFKTIRKNNLKQHALIHNKDRPQKSTSQRLQCVSCSFKTLRKFDLKRHLMRHQDDDGPGWHKCPECPYKTTYKSTFLRHAKRHKAADQTGWLECPECSYRTLRPQHLKAHKMLHNGGGKRVGSPP